MTVKEHYDNHLANFYSWMKGDFWENSNEFRQFLIDNHILPFSSKIAVDLGAGHGIQSIPLAESGFSVVAVDFNRHLLDELEANANGLKIKIINDDMKNIADFDLQPELITCCGDTLSHLSNKAQVNTFIADIVKSLINNGKLILSFRDYSTKLSGTDRIIPVKSDQDKILTCILDYEDEYVMVTDLLHQKTGEGWKQKVSTYKKVRLLTYEVIEQLEANDMDITFNQVVNRMTTIIATRNK